MEDQWKFFIKYVDDHFSQWKDWSMPRTYVTPPIYNYQKKHVPLPGASNYDPGCYGNMKSHYTQSVEEHIVSIFVRFGDYSHQPMFVFTNFEFKKLVVGINKLTDNNILQLHPQQNEYQKETDLIIVHRKYGIILVEIKSNIKDYEEAQNQLNVTESLLYDDEHLSEYFQLDHQLKFYVVAKVIACPCQNESDIREEWCKPGFVNLCKNHIDTFENFSRWWDNNIMHSFVKWWKCCITHGVQINKHCESIYSDLVPKLLCNPKTQCSNGTFNRDFMHINISKKTIQEDLHSQRLLKKQKEEKTDIEKAQSKIEKVELEINKIKVEIKEAELQIQFKPLFCNINSHIQNVIVHIKKAKLMMENAKATTCTIQRVIPTEDLETSVLQDVWKYITPDQHKVWNNENRKQIIFGPYGSGKTILIQCKAADLALSGKNVLVIVPTDHLMTKYKVFFDKHVRAKNKSQEVYVKIIIIKEEITVPDLEHEKRNVTKKWKNEWNSVGGKIMLLSLKIFSKDFWLYKKLAKTSHIFIDEFLWLPLELQSPEYDLKNFLMNFLVFHIIHRKKKYNYVWIAPHLYIVLTVLLRPQSAHKDLVVFALSTSVDRHMPITMLGTTMRTTKQIHDFMIQKEWDDFCKYEFSDKRLHFLFKFYDKIFKSVLCNSHGHHITGPQVRIVKLNCGITNPHGKNMLDVFLHHCAEAIGIEVNRLLTVCKMKLQDIAIMIDAFPSQYKHVKETLLEKLNPQRPNPHVNYNKYCSFDQQQEIDSNAVVICNCDHIASLEWPVVIHVKCFYHWNSSNERTFIEGYSNMIASRCTMQYIIICSEVTKVAWPHSKSLQNFNLWCGSNFETRAFYEYKRI